jgi:hypothetical protein
MGTPAETLIATFEQLPDMEKQEVASAILRRTFQSRSGLQDLTMS